MVVLTADASDETRSSALATGVRDYLLKDKTSGTLLIQAIEVALSAKTQWIKSLATIPHFVDPTPSSDSPTNQNRPPVSTTDWPALVEQVKAGSDAGIEQLYKLLSRGIR